MKNVKEDWTVSSEATDGSFLCQDKHLPADPRALGDKQSGIRKRNHEWQEMLMEAEDVILGMLERKRQKAYKL